MKDLESDARDFLSAIKHWDNEELRGGISGHKITKMRPILIAIRICNKILERSSEPDDNEQLICDCQDFDNGLVSNYCPIHNENPYKPER